jgi:PST family polysaccharide transporter
MPGALGRAAARVRELLSGATARSSFIVACGNAAQALASLATTVVVSRHLGPEGYGVFSVALGAATTAAPIIDFGLDPSLLRQAARANAAGDTAAIARYVEAAAQLKCAFYLLIGGTGVALSGWLARSVLRYPHAPLLRWACVGALGLNLLTLGRGLLEARQRFLDVAIATAGTSFLRLAVVAGLWLAVALTPGTALLIYLAAPAAGLAYALWRQPDISFRLPTFAGLARERRELLAFSGWAGVGSIFAAITNYLDMALINRWCDPASVGYYAAAYRFAFVLITASFPIASVLRARASAFQTVDRLEAYLDKARIMIPLAALGVAAVWLAAPLVVRVFLGPAYAPSVPLIRILSLGTGVMFVAGPYSMAFYALGRSRPLAALSFVNLVVFPLCLRLLIRRYGIAGAAWAFTITHSTGVALMLVFIRSNMALAREKTLL